MSTVTSRQYNFVDDRNSGIPITASRIDAEYDNIITKLNQKVIIAPSAPSSPIEGLIWYDSTNDQLKQYRNSEWIIMGAVHFGPTAMATPQAGDTWYDTSGSELVVKVRNKANDAWIELWQRDDTALWLTGDRRTTYRQTPATGWIFCYGQTIGKTGSGADLTGSQYEDLFNVLKNVAPNAGTEDFDNLDTVSVPDERGRTAVGKDDMGGSSANVNTDTEGDEVGGQAGEKEHVLTVDEMPAHDHDFTGRNANGWDGSDNNLVQGTNASGASATLDSTSVGGGQAHENMPPYTTVNVEVKL